MVGMLVAQFCATGPGLIQAVHADQLAHQRQL